MSYGPVQSNTVEEARRRLREYGAKHVEDAIRDNPEGPVQTLCSTDREAISYEVVVGDIGTGDRGRARVIWSRDVAFGNKRNNVAGGTDFVNAAREQDRVAWAVLKLIQGDDTPATQPITPDPDATAPILRRHLKTNPAEYEVRERTDGAYDVRELPDGAWQFCPAEYFRAEFCDDAGCPTYLRKLVKQDPIGFPVPIARSILEGVGAAMATIDKAVRAGVVPGPDDVKTLRDRVNASLAGPFDTTLEDPDAPPEPGAIKKQGTWVDERGFIVEPGHPQQGCKLENSEGYVEEGPKHVTPEILHEILLLVVECPPSIEAIRAWTPAQLDEVEAWAVATHVAANDHIDITPPAYPLALGPTRNGVPVPCGNCGKGGHIAGTCPNPVVYR